MWSVSNLGSRTLVTFALRNTPSVLGRRQDPISSFSVTFSCASTTPSSTTSRRKWHLHVVRKYPVAKSPQRYDHSLRAVIAQCSMQQVPVHNDAAARVRGPSGDRRGEEWCGVVVNKSISDGQRGVVEKTSIMITRPASFFSVSS